ncbi:sigma-54-dependent transcriptional regulator [Lignipirellula cremea]|uniref:Transcriptional regulatory protein ZraR n=1 Tax=Lignipirellula cremea TaxID=2528010 RepID=A0A518DQ46_9BACT|nr:sigma-54 dependent transcriptional regulator [Lignipirellula cremea]QDU93972.1 Transcriptional regulatory protein ZraR [Lignipirellula cremea]
MIRHREQPVAGAVLVVDDHESARRSMVDVLRGAGHQVDSCSSAVEALTVLKERTFDVIVTDLRMPGMTGLEFMAELQRRGSESQVVMSTAYASVETAVEAMRYGAFDYLEKPFNVDQLEDLVGRALRHCEGPGRSRVPEPAVASAMIGDSPAMQTLRARIAQAGPTDVTVLITGESGVGKELVARELHAASRRRNKALVSVNCPVLSPQLMESELFGHERGAFTSAEAPRVGRFELADGGAIFLDEVTEIDPPLQAKLLRVLQERTFERVGSSRTQSVDARVIAATNRDLRAEVEAGRFREDLYFRLAVIPLTVPPLRERRSDIGLLCDHFLVQAGDRMLANPKSLEPAALELLHDYHWPGNIRELENLMIRASVLSPGETIAADDLEPWLITDQRESTVDDAQPTFAVGASLRDMERKLIESTLDHFDGHRVKTAKALGIGVRTLSTKLRQYGCAPRAKTFACSESEE